MAMFNGEDQLFHFGHLVTNFFNSIIATLWSLLHPLPSGHSFHHSAFFCLTFAKKMPIWLNVNVAGSWRIMETISTSFCFINSLSQGLSVFLSPLWDHHKEKCPVWESIEPNGFLQFSSRCPANIGHCDSMSSQLYLSNQYTLSRISF